MIHFKDKINSRHLTAYHEDLRKILQRCIKNGSPYFCEGKNVDSQMINQIREKKKYSDLDMKEKKILLDIIEWILTKCVNSPKCMPDLEYIKPLSENLFRKKLGSIEGQAVIFDFPDEEFQKLRNKTIKRFFKRSEGGGNPFYPPPDDLYGPDKESTKEGPFSYIKSEKMYLEDENCVDIGFFFDVEGIIIQTKTRMDRFVFENLIRTTSPKKVVLPVDIGCFYYGL